MDLVRASRTTVAFLAMLIPQLGAASPGMVDVEVLSDRGVPFRTFGIAARGGDPARRAYLEAVRGERYSLRIRNNSGRRVGLVVAVDGRNIVSGRKSFLGSNERMYILDPYAEGIYEGWRTGDDRVNRFYFTDAGDSYAGAWGDFSAMGVLAIAVYPERWSPPPPPPAILGERGADSRHRAPEAAPGPSPGSGDRGASAVPNGLSAGKQAAENARREPGTGFGEERHSPSVRVAFVPENRAVEKHFLKYEWRDTLCRKGIIDCRVGRNRFWDDDDYAPRPPGRRTH